MDREVKSRLQTEFPEGENWGWRRHRSSVSMFWRGHKRLTGLSDRQILIALMWAHYIALQFGLELRLYSDEKKLWARHFVIAEGPIKRQVLLSRNNGRGELSALQPLRSNPMKTPG